MGRLARDYCTIECWTKAACISVYLLQVHAASGGGKSHLMGRLARDYCTIEGWTKAACISVYLLQVHAASGGGKSHLMGRLARDYCTIEGWTKAACISVYLLQVHAASGGGKSHLMGRLVRDYCTIEDWTKAACISRFIPHKGMTVQGLVASIASQLCVLLNIPQAFAYKVSEATLIYQLFVFLGCPWPHAFLNFARRPLSPKTI